MLRSASMVLLLGAASLGLPASAGAQGITVDVVLPQGRFHIGRSVRAVRPVRPRFTHRHIVVHVPLLAQGPSRQCLQAHVLRRLAAMVDTGGGVRQNLAAGAGFICSAFNGTLERWPNGERAMTLGRSWFYPNGERANAVTGSWFYPDGTRARSPTGTWYYPNGEVARRRDGTWLTPGGGRIGRLDRPIESLATVATLQQLWQL